MRKIKRYIANVVFWSILVVLSVIVALDVISSIVDQLGSISGDYNFVEVLIFTALKLPATIYEYLPMAALIGCLVGLGILANSNELVVIRSAGVSVSQIIWAVMRPTIIVIIVGTLLGEYVSPYTSQYGDSRRALALGNQQALQSERGVWNREGSEYMHFNAVMSQGKLFGITRYRFDNNGKMTEASFVESAIYQGDYWFEQNGVVTLFNDGKIERKTFATRYWETDISPGLLNVLVLPPENLPINRLHTQAKYLAKQGLDSSEYRLAYWNKVLQPLTIASLVMIAVSFILGPLRQTTMGFRVFVGVIVGLIFQTSQKILGPTSIIFGFSPLFAVLIPVAVCFLFGLTFLYRAR